MQVDILFPINAGAFTYSVPESLRSDVEIGKRVLVPFRGREKVGIIIDIRRDERLRTLPELKQIKAVIDGKPLFHEGFLRLLQWTSEYYLSSPGLVLKNALPSALFTGKKAGKPRIGYTPEPAKGYRVELTEEQKKALDRINSADSGVFLLHGVTGSGKTEVYIHAIKSLQRGKEAIVLVPEIALTAQMIDRFYRAFGDKVGFFHSGLSMGERLQCWQGMRDGKTKVVIGVRSAVFAPFRNLGLIVVDEEQESSYKQCEGLRYNARDVALARAKLEGIKVILGSATPSLESYHNARTGRFHYLELSKRIDNKPMPQVEIIDMTEEGRGSRVFSDKLLSALKEAVSQGQQALIMLNRRGYSPYPICTDCGYTYKCPACSITLVYHKDTNTLNCHYCGSYLNPRETCPKCKGTRIKYLGLGTQRVEEELKGLIPELSLKRMDRDTTTRKLSHHRIVRQMEEGEIDVLLGTQMVAKGHDFPDVVLSAIVSADIALNLPDFRSAERAYQLFTQLAGRAGRGGVPGRVYIQTYEKGHYIFDYVRHHDFNGFLQKEMSLRKELSYPPFSRLVRIILSFRSQDIAKKTIREVSERIQGLNITDVEVLGPAPAPIERIRKQWRWHLILKGRAAKTLRRRAVEILEAVKGIRDVKIDVDVDPVEMF